jgi:hypothetical protein
MMQNKVLLILGLLSNASVALASLFNPSEGVRPTGMGGAFLAISDDSNAIWYNPAGLARLRGAHANLVDFTLGADSLDTVSRIQNAVFNGDYQNLVRNDREFFRLNIRPTFLTRFLALQPYINNFSFFDVRALNETDPLVLLNSSVQIKFENDIGLIGATALPLGPYASIGLSVRAFQRSAVDTKLTATDFITGLGMTQSEILSNIFQNVMSRAGMGLALGANVGLLLRVPMPAGYPEIRFAAVAEDLGATRFLALGTYGAPPSLPTKYHFGSAAMYRWGSHGLNLALDLRQNFSDLYLLHQTHLGAEYRYRAISLRAGMYQGYWTAGASLEFPPHTRLHFSTYAVETGERMWQDGVRFYLMQLVIGFNPI